MTNQRCILAYFLWKHNIIDFMVHPALYLVIEKLVRWKWVYTAYRVWELKVEA